jgi:hypothetical protein
VDFVLIFDPKNVRIEFGGIEVMEILKVLKLMNRDLFVGIKILKVKTTEQK